MTVKISELPNLPSPSDATVLFALDSQLNANTSYQLKISTLKTYIGSQAFAAANTSGNTANGAVVIATSAFAAANSATANVTSAYMLANSAFTKANTANDLATFVYSYSITANTLANSAFTKANAVSIISTNAYNQANNANTLANSAFAKANSASSLATSAFNYANSLSGFSSPSFDQANTAYYLANSAFTAANVAYALATSNVVFNYANMTFSLANSAYYHSNTTLDAVTSLSDVVQTANAYTQNVASIASVGYVYGNNAYAISNTNSIVSVSAYNQANVANTLANTKVTAPTSVIANSLSYFSSIDPKVLANCSILIVNRDSLNSIRTIGFLSEYDNGNSGASKTILLSNGQRQKITLTSNTTLTINTSSALVSTYTLRIIQNSSGNNYITWSGLSSSRWIGSTTAHDINVSANGESLMSLYYDGTNLIQNIGKVGQL
jgi:hypothetical protein